MFQKIFQLVTIFGLSWNIVSGAWTSFISKEMMMMRYET